MPEAVPINLPFDEAIAFFAAKGLELSPNDWRDVWREANVRSFTVARVNAMDVLSDIRAEVGKAIETGTSLGQFKKDLVPLLERKGWFAPRGEKAIVTLPGGEARKRLTAWRLKNIYMTNLQTAYSAGRHKQMLEVADARPYWQYKAIMDSTTRPAHAAMHNKVYDYRHPIWDTWFPQNGFFCRCYVKSLSAEDVKERGLKVETRGVDVQPDEGWDYNPGKEAFGSGWDRKGHLPDCGTTDFAEGGCIRIISGQGSWKDYGRPDLRDVDASLRQPAPSLLKAGETAEDALATMMEALGLSDKAPVRRIRTPIEEVLIARDQVLHMVEKRADARERYGLYVLPTLLNPFEIYLTKYGDGLRKRYIGLFTGKEDIMSIVRVNRDGSLLWNIMQAKDKDMNKNRAGELLWPR